MEPKLKDKRWRHELEEAMVEKWKDEDWWKFRNNNKPVVVMDTPPAYPGPFWHFGAAVSYAFQDIVARSYRMRGHNVLYPMCFDNNGIPVEWYVEKYEGVSMRTYPRDKFIELCSRALDKYVSRMKKIMRRMLISSDFEESYYLTDSDDFRTLTQSTFIDLYKKGMIYMDDRPNNWCPRCQTTIADAEVERNKINSSMWTIDFKIKGTGNSLPIATTRPELLGACDAVIVNPEDERHRKIIGEKAVVPLYSREVPIIARKEADMEFGTGAMMVCSYGDKIDVKLFNELGLEPRKMINTDGTMTKESGYGDMAVQEAREKLVKDLEDKGLLLDSKKHSHQVPVHDKCKTPIEIIAMQEFYLNQVDFKNDVMRIAKKLEFHPEKHRQRLLDWIETVSMDWPISRRRYYATEIPIWYCSCGYVHLPNPGKYYRPWKEGPGVSCPKCGSSDWKGEDRTLDTWVDSSVTILYLTKYNKDPDFFKKTFVKGLKIRPQGYEIIRTWLYYSLLRTYQLLKKPAFDIVMVHGMGLDRKGKKMSKSLGNVVSPEEVIEEFGSDSIRFWAITESSFGEDYRISKQRIGGAQKFLTKLWNIARFVSMFPEPGEKPSLTDSDRWILAEASEFKRKCVSFYKDFDFISLGREAMGFMWNKFASHYVEMVKSRAFEGDKSAAWALNQVLKDVLLVMAPVIPGITDYVWRKLYDRAGVHRMEFGSSGRVVFSEMLEKTEKLMGFNSKVWKTKKEKGIKLNQGIRIKVPKGLEGFSSDLKRMHNLE